MEMRIVVPDAESASLLADRLSVDFGSECVSLRREQREVDVLIDREPEPAILRILDAVERWLDQAHTGSAEMWLGERSYRLARWVPVETWH
jgi:hypothetical protein